MTEEETRKDVESGELRVNPGYAVFQIAKALVTSEEHEDEATRERARDRISKWTAVINGLLNGDLSVGSRTPVEGVPGWATLEVVTGGFATGQLLAGGPLRDHERELLSKVPGTKESDVRSALNTYFLTDEGLAKLREMLRSGCYDVEVPEEGALLVAAWLVENGQTEAARDLLEDIAPYLSRLRFYPIPADRPRRFSARVHLRSVGEAIQSLEKINPHWGISLQKEAVGIWAPLYDRMVALFLETVEGDTPHLQVNADGKWVRDAKGRFPLQGGWPCQHYSEDWAERAWDLLDEYDIKRKTHSLCKRPERKKDSFAQLREFLRRCAKKPKSLEGRDVGRIRLLLARYVTKRGTPDSTQCRELRERQARDVSAPTFHEIAGAVIPRLKRHPGKDGLDSIDPITRPLNDKEAALLRIPEGTEVPDTIQRKVERCLIETVEVLVERGIITSGETLARVLPQMTGGLRAAGITNPALRQLYAVIYHAFRRRRSLLLLDLEKQIQIEELPWVAAVDRFRQENLSSKELARQALEGVLTLTISAFPQAILPNKLLQELRALAKTAELDLPLVDEVAADIFMGQFSNKFLQAAKIAGGILEGTLYATYYGIDYAEVRAIPEIRPKKTRSWFSKDPPDPFMKLCESRAGVCYGSWDVAINGMIIEQEQILTTQNLAVPFRALNLAEVLRDRLGDLARHCFAWICKRHQMKFDKWHARLIMLKNTAYAWRQMVFFLALLPADELQNFLDWAREHLAEQSTDFQNRFIPALNGLVRAAEGNSPNQHRMFRTGGRCFLGWTKKRHWLLG